MDHEPLAENEIRILHLLPSRNSEAEIRCNLSRKTIKPLTYSALSYVWGEPNPAQAISINGMTVYVTPNLFAALRSLRHATEKINIWVDALCINQDDNLEKSHQVRQMGNIYKGARPVYIWLGEEMDDSNLAMELIQLLETMTRDIKSGKTKKETPKLWSDIMRDKSYEQHWPALSKLCNRPYWTRAWIVQEITATDYGILCCGASRASWFPLMILFSNRALSGIVESLSPGARQFFALKVVLGMPLAQMNWRVRNEVKIPLLDGLLFIRNHQATDPKDFVYSILNLVYDCSLEPDYDKSVFTLYRDVVKLTIEQNGNLDILSACNDCRRTPFSDRMKYLEIMRPLLSYGTFTVNFEQHCFKTYHDELAMTGLNDDMSPLSEKTGTKNYANPNADDDSVAKHLILKISSSSWKRGTEPENLGKKNGGHLLGLRNSNLEILDPNTRDLVQDAQEAMNKSAENYLPSWVPDWREPRPADGNLLFIDPTKGKCYYRASSDSAPGVQFLEDEYVMLVDGIRISSIGAVSKHYVKNTHQKEAVLNCMKAEFKLWTQGHHPRNVYGNQQKQEEAYRYTVAAGKNRDGSKGASILANNVQEYRSQSRDSSNESESNQSRALVYPISRSTRFHELMHCVSLLLLFRFAITSQGYMARVPNGTEPSDIIAIFSGAKVPHVLRRYKDQDKYFLIGECCKSIPEHAE